MIKLIFPLLLALCTHTAYAQESLALSTSLADTASLQNITNAHNEQIRLLSVDELGMDNLWPRLRAGFTLQALDNPLISKHEKWYADRPEYITRMMTRANRYLYYITVEVERRGMPSEIALLPMIESAFNPSANSTSNASGIWQFMPMTGRNFGLQQNWWYDGRRDIIGATTGALDYLEKLHTMFGSWELALAAYNWGEGSVQRAQARNRIKGLPVDYASLTLPDETRNYVPKLLAIKNIIANPADFGLTLPDIPNKPYFTAVSTAKHIDVALAAELADISGEEFIALNPAHNRPVILQENSSYILLPVDKVETYQNNLETYDKPLVSWQAYHAKKGERLDHLAPRFGLSLERLKSVNGLSAQARFCNDETLLVPLNGEPGESENEFEGFNMHLHPAQKKSPVSLKYTVQSGDTLSKLARRYHVSVDSLKNWNGEIRHVKAGQTLTISPTWTKRGAKGSPATSGKHGRKAARKHRR
ncbi:MAG: transglycosylase SLT domain-containing protein [Gallionella sp.]|nr:transglycosylase SLT domain-containing protein [Gallionella sp.]